MAQLFSRTKLGRSVECGWQALLFDCIQQIRNAGVADDINSKLRSSELFDLFFGGGSMEEWVATDRISLGQMATMEPMASHTQCERKCATTMMSL